MIAADMFLSVYACIECGTMYVTLGMLQLLILFRWSAERDVVSNSCFSVCVYEILVVMEAMILTVAPDPHVVGMQCSSGTEVFLFAYHMLTLCVCFAGLCNVMMTATATTI